MSIGTLIIVLIAFIAGIFTGRDYESKKCLEDMLNNFAETEHLRNENAYLKKKLGFVRGEDVENGTE
jgi:hypothetical protein